MILSCTPSSVISELPRIQQKRQEGNRQPHQDDDSLLQYQASQEIQNRHIKMLLSRDYKRSWNKGHLS